MDRNDDRSQYLNDGLRDRDAREGFGDDAGTRVGRPDGAGSDASDADPNRGGMRAAGGEGGARPAPHDVSGSPRPGQAGTNAGPVPDGIEGSLQDGDDAEQGEQQSRVQRSAEGLNQGRAAGDDRPTYDL